MHIEDLFVLRESFSCVFPYKINNLFSTFFFVCNLFCFVFVPWMYFSFFVLFLPLLVRFSSSFDLSFFFIFSRWFFCLIRKNIVLCILFCFLYFYFRFVLVFFDKYGSFLGRSRWYPCFSGHANPQGFQTSSSTLKNWEHESEDSNFVWRNSVQRISQLT